MAEEKQQKQQEVVEAGEGSLLDEIIEATRVKPSDEAYEITKRGVKAFIDELLKPTREGVKVTKNVVDEMIAQLDSKLSAQVNEILHHKDFQKLESAWRSLKYLVDNTDFRENIKINILNVSKQDLLDDFEDSPEIPQSGFIKLFIQLNMDNLVDSHMVP